jgi:hypothetical protein
MNPLIQNMTNEELINYVNCASDSSVMERELAYRLDDVDKVLEDWQPLQEEYTDNLEKFKELISQLELQSSQLEQFTEVMDDNWASNEEVLEKLLTLRNKIEI